MKAKIFSFVKVSDDSMIASVRIARFLRDHLGIDLVWDHTISDETLDVLFIVNGAYAFAGSDLLESLGAAIQFAKRVVWVQNDYTIIPPKDESGAESPFRKAFRLRHESGCHPVDYWTTCEGMSIPGRAKTGHIVGPGSRYVNWNCLTMEDREPTPYHQREYRDQMIYYGAFRKDREDYFDRYFKMPEIRTTISCPNERFRAKYQGTKIFHMGKIPTGLYDFVGHFGLGLYIEDKKSHSSFHSPANRFYEMLSAGTAMVFQPEAMKMLKKAGYEVSDWTIWSGSLSRQLEEAEAIAIAQRNLIFSQALDSRMQLSNHVSTAWMELRSEIL